MKTKKRTLVISLSLLGSVALIGTGFATWVISQNASTTTNGNIITDTTTDNTLSITDISWDDKKDAGSICFGWDGEASKDAWLTNTDMSKKADLTSTVYFSVGPVTAIKDVTATIAIAEGSKATWDANQGDLVALPTSLTPTLVNPEAKDETTAKYKCEITFTWGSHFGGKNPLTYYNEHKANEKIGESETTYAADAKASLDKLSKLNNCQFVVTFSATAKAANDA